MPTRVGIVLDDSVERPNGVQQIVRTTGRFLARQGFEVHVITSHATRLPDYAHTITALSKTIRLRANGNEVDIPWRVDRSVARSIASELQLDVLLVHSPYSPLLAHRVILGAPPSCKVIALFHLGAKGRIEELATRQLAILTTRSRRRIAEVIVDSPISGDLVTRAWKRTATMIPNPIELAEFAMLSPRRRQVLDPFHIVFVGRLVPRKGCAELLHAIACLNRSRPCSLRVTIVGSGTEMGRLRLLANSLGIANIVTFLGQTGEEEKRETLSQADLAVFPSLYAESFGMVIVEALAAGATAVVAGRNAGYAHVLRATPEAVADPRDTEAFARTLQNLMDNDAARACLGARQRESVLDLSDVDHAGLELVRHLV